MQGQKEPDLKMKQNGDLFQSEFQIKASSIGHFRCSAALRPLAEDKVAREY